MDNKTRTADAYNIPNARRNLYLKIVDNYADYHAITNRLYFLDDHFPPNQLDDALKWLVSNNIRGRTFVSWFTHVCAASDLEMHRLLLAVLENLKPDRVIIGKNFKA